jgi:hypothetical protein
MSCETISRSRPHLCKTQGGLKNLYFINFDAELFANKTVANNEITDFGTPASPYDLQLEDTNEVSGEAGTSFYSPTVTAVLKKQTPDDSAELEKMSKSRPIIIVEDYAGNFKLVGGENGMDVVATAVSGSAMGENNGYNIEATGKETRPALFVDPTIIGDDTNTSIVVNA